MKQLIFIFLLFMSGFCYGQSTEDIINRISGEMDESLIISDKANIAEITGIATAVVPLILFPISLYVPNPHKTNLEISYYTFSAAAVTLYLTGFIISEIHKNKAREKLQQLYEYQKIVSGNYEINKEFSYELDD